LAVAVLGLLGVFGWLVWQPAKAEPTTHFVALLTGDSDLLSLPPILFEQATVAPLEALDERSDTLKFVDASESQLAGDATAIEAALAREAIGDEDRLIVYVSAHGVSDGGTPYVLARDYNLLSREAGRCSAVELLQAVSRVKAATKLVVFDCSRLAVHPRMGMAANEFASLVKAAADDVDDPHLAVLLAGDELEFSPLGLAERRSVLGGALVDALLEGDGAAGGGDGDRNLTLGELTSFVMQKCAGSRVAAPVPVLVACGGAASTKELDGKTIFRVPPPGDLQSLNELLAQATKGKKKNPKQAPSEDKPPQGDSPAPKSAEFATAAPPNGAAGRAAPATEGSSDQKKPEGQPTTGSETPGAGGQGAPAAEPSNEGEAAPATSWVAGGDAPTATGGQAADGSTPVPPAAVDNSPPIIQAWRYRDRLADETAAELRGLPVDYAPHLWNELNLNLVSLQLELLGKDMMNPREHGLADLVGPYFRGLGQLADGTAVPGEGLIGGLGAAQRSFAASRQADDLQRLDRRYVQALLELRRGLVRANHFVRWHAAAVAASGGAGAAESAAQIEQLLDGLQALDGAIADFEAESRRSWNDAEQMLPALDRAQRNVHDSVSQLMRRLDIHVGAIAARPNAAGQRELETLLATDVATAAQRETLLAALGNAKAIAAKAEPTAARWSDFVDHLWLEVRLAQVADSATPGLVDIVEEVLRVRTSPGTNDEQRKETARRAGLALWQFYKDLPTRLTQLQRVGASDAEGRTAERLVTLVHPRDVSSALVATVGFVTPRMEPPAELALRAPPPTNLREGEATPLEWALRLQNASAARATVTLEEFDAQALEVWFADSGQAARSGESRTYPARDGLRVTLLVRPRSASSASVEERTESIHLRVELEPNPAGLSASARANVVVPRPDRVELIAHTVKPRFRSDGLLLQPYPNRSTTFGFALVNFGDEAKKLKVELKAVPELQGPRERFVDAGWPPGRLLDAEGREPAKLAKWAATALDDAAVIASVEIDLPADGKPHALQLVPPNSEAPAEAPKDAAAGGSAAPPPPEPKPPTSVDATHGLVFRITDAARPEDVTLKWVEIVPLHAYSYFDFQAGFVNPGARNSDVRFSARPRGVDDDGERSLPPEIGEAPVPFVIRGDGTVIPSGPAAPYNFAANNEFVRLDVQPLANLHGTHAIAMDVDHVPRAMKWSVDFEDRTVEPDQSPSIRIMRVAMPKPDQTPGRLYRTTPFVDFPEIDRTAWLPVVDIGEDGVCAFDVSRSIRPPLEIRLQVDAPRRAFNGVGDGSAIVVSWEGENLPGYNLYYDRDIRSEIVKFTDAGEMIVKSTVDDIVFKLPTPGVNNKPVTLAASLYIEGVVAATDKLTVVLDQAAPRIPSVRAPDTIVVGTKEIDLRATVVDLSGVDTVEAWFTPKRPRSQQDLDPNSAERLAILDPGLLQFSADEPRLLLLRAPTPKEAGTYYLTLRVTDRSGQASDTIDQEHVVQVIPPPPPPVPGPLVGDLKGQVLLMPAGKPAPAGLTVSVQEKPAFSATTVGEGKFIIKQLEAGTYTLVVEGLVASRPVTGEQPVTLAAKGDYEWKTVVKASVEWADPPKD
jgi:hypothetical protein